MLIQACPARDRVRVAIAGVGNCASSFVQGLHHYWNVSGNEPIAGLMNADVGGYRLADIEIAAAFDVSAAKVGRDVSEAIVAKPNNTARFFDVPGTGVIVQRDSPNSAGVVIDAVRCAKLALDREIGGPLIGPSSYFMKSPPRQFSDEEARTLRFIAGTN